MYSNTEFSGSEERREHQREVCKADVTRFHQVLCLKYHECTSNAHKDLKGFSPRGLNAARTPLWYTM